MQANNIDKSTCELKCPDGYTSNGDPNRICVKCNEMCKTCRDDGKVGDKDICVSCADKYPFFYPPSATCLQQCTNGFYKVSDKTCDKCGTPCENCEGDKYNCLSCDHKSANPALYKTSTNVRGEVINRGTCRSTCPA